MAMIYRIWVRDDEKDAPWRLLKAKQFLTESEAEEDLNEYCQENNVHGVVLPAGQRPIIGDDPAAKG